MDTYRRIAFAALLGLGACAQEPRGHLPLEQMGVVEEARQTLEQMRIDPSRRELNFYLQNARGVLILPSQLKGALLIGGSGGTGVMLSRNADGSWSCPAFYSVGSVSYWLQIGAMRSETVVVLMNDEVLRSMMEEGLRIGVDASAAFGGVGGGAQASSSNMFRDVYIFTQSSGVFVGLSAELGVVAPRDGWNAAYYGRPVGADDILLKRSVCNPDADRLRANLARN
jgi:lipid-binding SYLF domain-containing protein